MLFPFREIAKIKNFSSVAAAVYRLAAYDTPDGNLLSSLRRVTACPGRL